MDQATRLAQVLPTIDWNSLQQAVFPANSPFSTSTTIGFIVNRAIPAVFIVAGLLLLLYLIFGGYTYLTSAGNPKQMEAAKSTITSALIGFVIIFSAYWIVRAIGVILGLPQIRSIFGGA